MPEQRAQRQFLGTLNALIRGADVPADDGSRHVASFIRKNKERAASAVLLLVSMSPNDPLPVHCLLVAKDGRRLADSNRVCQLRDRFYSWPSRFEGHWYEATIKSRILVCNLLSQHELKHEPSHLRRRFDDV